MEIDLKPGINLLIGDNGAGKTSVLEGIAVALSGLFVNVPGVSTKNIVKDDVRMLVTPKGDSSTTLTYYEPVSAGCSLKSCDGNKFSWNRIKEERSSTHTKIDNKEVCVDEKIDKSGGFLLATDQFSKRCQSVESSARGFWVRITKKIG